MRNALRAVGVVIGLLSADFAYAGPYRLLLESDADAAAGSELFVATYDSLADFLNNNSAGGSFSDVGLSPGFSAGGFTFDGSQYHLLLEADADAAAGSELFVATYNSLADFLNNNSAGGSFSDVGLSPGFSVGGFTFDGGLYHLLVETNADAAAGSELFVATYNSLADFLNNNSAGGSFSDVGISPGFSAAAFLAEPSPAPTAVPEPATALMLAAGIAAAGIRRLRAPRAAQIARPIER